ncbi:hypothetical protein HYALB_00006067 [Hymenoscyphus albidus]|uniref:Zn(2)-C6 fungal-type domain-containing protein n=1 Tax=Hymenoscyphus albidus TaxID=595503 RepID=A0A9N9LX08_9HELO|nr:hypothetical protein HYALB_00006067 [Hymenoscyphus albidus]
MANNLDPRLQSAAPLPPPSTPSNFRAPNPIAANSTNSQSPQQQQQYPPLQEASHYAPQPHHPQLTPENGPATPASGGGSKRPRACEPCRHLKVKCIASAVPGGPCERCAKANKQCQTNPPSRKRQKKTDTRVEELERTVAQLKASAHQPGSQDGGNDAEPNTAALHTAHNPYQQVTNGGYNHSFAPPSKSQSTQPEFAGYPKVPEQYSISSPSVAPMVVAGQKRRHTESRESSGPIDPSLSSGGFTKSSLDKSGGPHQYGGVSDASSAPKAAQTHEYADVVDRNLLSAEKASLLFDTYVTKMAPHLPAVVFPKGTTAAEIRKTKPTLFLAILSASSGMIFPELQRTLTKEVMSIYAERIIMNGEKTLELIQALHISTLWYWPPEHFEELKFYQFIHIAAVMAIDIGMGKRNKPKKAKFAGLWRDSPWRRTPYPDPESAEARRAWLACYFLCCTASMGLRRPNLIRWGPFMVDCIEFLETSPEAAPSDKILCQWVRSQHIAEDVGTQFSMDDPMATITIADSKVQYALKGFERDLEKWSDQVPPEAQSIDLQMTQHVVSLYAHEVAMHVDHNVEEFKPPFTEETLAGLGEREVDKLTTAHIDALSTCLMSIDGILESFLKFDVETSRCLPVYNFIRVAYAVVVLIKMYFAAATPNSELGKVINKDHMKVEHYLDTLVDTFRKSAADDKSRPSAKFLMVLLMLKTWFHRQREGKAVPHTEPGSSATLLTADSAPPPTEEADTKGRDQNGTAQNGQQNFNQVSNLQLLSEVATNNSRGESRGESGGGQYTGSANDWQQMQHQQQQQQFTDYDSMNPMSAQQNYGTMPGGLDPSLGLELGYAMGDGFEQAIGMTLGAGDGNYFNENAFFGNLMGPNGFDGF